MADTRPTTDKVREAVFNALGSLDLVRDARVADLFAGTGALGIEALSRGAAHCTFVERDRAGAPDSCATTSSTSASPSAAGSSPATRRRRRPTLDVDLVFADPPYEFDGWIGLLSAVRAPFVVAEAGRSLESLDGLADAGWRATRSKRYGRTWVTFFERIDR